MADKPDTSTEAVALMVKQINEADSLLIGKELGGELGWHDADIKHPITATLKALAAERDSLLPGPIDSLTGTQKGGALREFNLSSENAQLRAECERLRDEVKKVKETSSEILTAYHDKVTECAKLRGEA